MAGSSLLSETASNYVLMPLTESGEVNAMPLMAYAQELGEDRRGPQVLERFRGYDADPEAVALIEQAAACAEAMREAQLRAIELMRVDYPLPDTPPLTAIPRVELTEAERAMTAAERESTARTLVLGSVYAVNRQTVSQCVNACVGALQATSARRAAEASARISRYRALLWAVTGAIIALLALAFAALYRQILLPLARFVKLIPADVPLDETRGFHEVRLVASAYNGVLKRRNALDDILRSAAETDALTSLPNRYRFEQYLLESRRGAI